MLKILYSVFIGILVATFIGLGVATFYPAPDQPEHPADDIREITGTPADEEPQGRQEEMEAYNRQHKEYEAASELYNRNVALIVVTAAVLTLVVSLTIAIHMAVIADSLLLGGVFTLIYGIGRSFAAGDTRITFAVVAIGLAVAITVGYIKFARAGGKRANKANSDKDT